MVERAFEETWFLLENRIDDRTCLEGLRVRLASVILMLAQAIKDEPERLKITALKVLDPDLAVHYETSETRAAPHEEEPLC